MRACLKNRTRNEDDIANAQHSPPSGEVTDDTRNDATEESTERRSARDEFFLTRAEFCRAEIATYGDERAGYDACVVSEEKT